MTQKTEILLITDFVNEKPRRVFLNPAHIVSATAFGSGRNSGVEILFITGNTLKIAMWDTHFAYALSERLSNVNLQIMDRREERAEIDDYLEAAFNIKPRMEESSERETASAFSSSKQESREKETPDFGQPDTCQRCDGDYHPDELGWYENEKDGERLKICGDCVTLMQEEGAELKAS